MLEGLVVRFQQLFDLLEGLHNDCSFLSGGWNVSMLEGLVVFFQQLFNLLNGLHNVVSFRLVVCSLWLYNTTSMEESKIRK